MALLVWIPLATGCASTKGTLAQDLARQRWETCSYVRTITLREIKPDGQIWAWARDASDLAAWQACDRRAQENQASGAAVWLMSSPPPQARTPRATATAPPAWEPGDAWAFRWSSPAGKGVFIWTVDREEAIEGTAHYVIKTGTREIFYRKSDIATTVETLDGATVLINTPPRQRYVWPLRVGHGWQQTVVEERPGARHTAERVYAVTVEAEETVVVPAGTFDAFKLVYRNKATGGVAYEEWFSPSVKHAVMLREHLESGLLVRELIAFKLNDP